MLITTGVLSIVLYAQSTGSANRSAVAPQNDFVKRYPGWLKRGRENLTGTRLLIGSVPRSRT
jgi:hypothetical protein